MKIILLLGVLFLLAACQHEKAPPPIGLAGFDPHLIENQRQICLDRGGRFGAGGQAGTFVCYEDTKDANKQCSASTDCRGLCLARSRTCSPVTPLFGCHEVLGSSGFRSTLCLE